jgi:hypothetical protein
VLSSIPAARVLASKYIGVSIIWKDRAIHPDVSVIRMFRVEWEAARERWIENYDGEDGSSIESLRAKEVQRSLQRYESIREPSTAGGASTGKMGGRVYKSSPTDPT